MLASASGNWGRLYKHYQRFGACDDGALAEGYSDAVVRLFALKWNRFPEFAALAKRNSLFYKWTLRHIDATASGEDLAEVASKAEACQVGEAQMCQAIREAALAAMGAPSRTTGKAR